MINLRGKEFLSEKIVMGFVKQTSIQEYGNLVPTARLKDGQPRTILFDATKCIGCRHCVQACK
ncbi:MAG TPA: 4Fe-4S binding protein, partial [Candidatus Udaeobacter sp.]|nr:4Fe-4S binding protein [Candidatus Udaeobacter sp.]